MSPMLLWQPSKAFQEQSNLFQYLQWVNKTYSFNHSDYKSLWEWSVKSPSEFWESIWSYFNIIHEGSYSQVISEAPMPFTKWFEGTRLNYAEHIFRNFRDGEAAILAGSESMELRTITWNELQHQTASIQNVLIQHGIKEGDRIAAYLPCIPEATIAFLATNSLGAVWSSCSPDFGTQAAIDRFAQIQPRVLFATTSYQYGGKVFSRETTIKELLRAIPSIELLILIEEDTQRHEVSRQLLWKEIIRDNTSTLTFKRVPFDHPIWVLYSSGTTGLPKAITHSHGGVLLEQLKYCSFHNDFKQGENCFWYTTTGWMMWNYIHGALLTGGTMVIYDGSPAYPSLMRLWDFASKARIHHFGTSAGFILANLKEKLSPRNTLDLHNVRSIGSTGSTLPPEGFRWIYQHIGEHVWLASMSGGTDVCSAFVGGNPLRPVYEGEIQCRALGCSLAAFDENGNPVEDEEGEMVVTKPMPSMPVYFWNDPDRSRYKESYFETYPNVWRHGDWIKITPRDGVIIYGRSDATLNRGGIRIGTSEIYRAVERVDQVKDSLIVCIEKQGGEFWMPLFVLMKEGSVLTDDLKKQISQTIRTANSPRHVPDDIIAVPDIPYTISGKKTEMPVKKILMGKDINKVINTGSLRNPDSLSFFVAIARELELR